MNKNKEVKQEEKKEKSFKLPRYLRLDKGSMFFDEGTEDASGVRIYAIKKVLVGRDTRLEKYTDNKGIEKIRPSAGEVIKDEHDNKNLLDYGKIDADLPWYFDTTKIDPSKLSRILTAYKYGILVEADPENPPQEQKEKTPEEAKEFGYKDNGDRIFIGKNKEVYGKLMNLNFPKLRDFINATPITVRSRENLMDLYAYEIRGYNNLNRSRQEVLDLIQKKLKAFGPSMSSVRVNED